MNKSLIALALLAAGSAHAIDSTFKRPTPRDAEYQHKSQFLFNIGIQNGGDVVGRLVDSESGEVVDQARAGGYWLIEAGGLIAFPNMPVSLQVTGGILSTEVVSNINEGRSDFNRYAVTLIPFYNFGRQRIGLGASAHIEPELKARPEGGPNQDFIMDDEVAAVLQWDVRYDQNISVGARYTYLTYTITEATNATLVGEEIEANAFGVHFTYSF